MPVPNNKPAIAAYTPRIRDRTSRISSRVNNTGGRWGRLAWVNVVQPGQRDARHLPVQEQQRGQRLILGRRGDLCVDRKMRQKRLHLLPLSRADAACRETG